MLHSANLYNFFVIDKMSLRPNETVSRAGFGRSLETPGLHHRQHHLGRITAVRINHLQRVIMSSGVETVKDGVFDELTKP